MSSSRPHGRAGSVDPSGITKAGMSRTRGPSSTPDCAKAANGPERASQTSPTRAPRRRRAKEGAMEVLHPRCAGLDVHEATVVAAVRLVAGGEIAREVRTFGTTTAGLLELAEWLAANVCTQVAMEATGVYWKPVWHILAEGGFA